MGCMVEPSKLDSPTLVGLNYLMQLETPQAESWVEEHTEVILCYQNLN